MRQEDSELVEVVKSVTRNQPSRECDDRAAFIDMIGLDPARWAPVFSQSVQELPTKVELGRVREAPRKCSPGLNTEGDLLLYRCNWNIYSVSWGAQLDELLYFGCYLNLQLDG
jgi:hypothetical protein